MGIAATDAPLRVAPMYQSLRVISEPWWRFFSTYNTPFDYQMIVANCPN